MKETGGLIFLLGAFYRMVTSKMHDMREVVSPILVGNTREIAELSGNYASSFGFKFLSGW